MVTFSAPSGPITTIHSDTTTFTIPISALARTNHTYPSFDAAYDAVGARIEADQLAFLPGQLVRIRGDEAERHGIQFTSDEQDGDWSYEVFRVLVAVKDPRFRADVEADGQAQGFGETWDQWRFVIERKESEWEILWVRGCFLRLEVSGQIDEQRDEE